MITVQPFSLEIIKVYKSFYLLQHIVNVEELEIVNNTPSGLVPVDRIDAFLMPNGRIILAWEPALNIASMHNLVAIHGSVSENVNLISLERIIDIYDRPINSPIGTFGFTNSIVVLEPNSDWRCDSGKFGPTAFFNPDNVLNNINAGEIKLHIYEPILSVNGCGHIIYMEVGNQQEMADYYVNKSQVPNTTRTLWEILKLIREWSIVNQEPFNNNEEISNKSFQFFNELKITEEELSIIDGQIPMQVANYLSGSENARQRPEGILPISEDIKRLIFTRMASSSISALEYLNPGMWNLQELLEKENYQMKVDLGMFELLKKSMEPDRPVIGIQTRIFNNKRIILDKIANGEL